MVSRNPSNDFTFGAKSKAKLSRIHPDLRKVIEGALRITEVDFIVTGGIRTLSKQKRLVAAGRSWTMKSRHLTGHAVDVAAWISNRASWDMTLYKIIAKAVMTSSRVLDIPIVWGGNWEDKRDGPHFQLTWENYPD